MRELIDYPDISDELEAILAPDGRHDRRAALEDWRRRLVDRRPAAFAKVNLALAAATPPQDSRALPAPSIPA